MEVIPFIYCSNQQSVNTQEDSKSRWGTDWAFIEYVEYAAAKWTFCQFSLLDVAFRDRKCITMGNSISYIKLTLAAV